MLDARESFKESMEYLVGLGKQTLQTFVIEGKTYSTENLIEIKEPIYKAISLKTSTLTSIVDFINNNADMVNNQKLIIHIDTPRNVYVCSELDEERRREYLVQATALTSDRLDLDRYLPTEDFNIMLQSCFEENEHQKLLLQVSGCVKDNTIKDYGDDGVSQTATVKTGVASVNNVIVPNPVTLIPNRTFPEINQPESKFVFRMKSGDKTPYATLIEADGGAWRNEAMSNIAAFLENNINEKLLENVLIIA